MREIKFRAWDNGILKNVFTVNPKRKDHNGSYKENGYIMRLVRNHPFANKRGYVAEHRLLIEQQMKRFLKPKWDMVHHINGIRDDNRLENLKHITPSAHARLHTGQRNPNGQFVCLSKEFQQKKFRLFDKDRNLVQIYTLNELIAKTFRRGKFEYRGEFTGLKDNNRKEELYDNDIVEGTYRDGKGFTSKHGVIKYHISSFVLHCFDEDIDDSKPLDYYNYGFELFGNIYENKDLLK